MAPVLTTNPGILDHLAQTAHADPEPPLPVVEIVAERRYVFRTKPGKNDNLMLRIPGLVQTDFVGKDDETIERMKKHQLRRLGQEAIDRFDYLAELNGGRSIEFTPLGFLRGSVFQTDDADLAAYIRDEHINHPYGPKFVDGLYEDFGQTMVRSRYTEQLFPNTPAGMEALGQYDLKFEEDQKKNERLAKVDRGADGKFAKKTE